MTYAGTYKIRGIFLDIGGATANTVVQYRPSRHDLWSALDAWEREARTRRMFEWKEPKKRIPVPSVLITRRHEKRFTGCTFPVGGPKK